MKSLIIKEKDILAKEIIFIGFYIFFLSFFYIVSLESWIDLVILFSAILGSGSMLLFTSMNYDELYNSEKLFNSFPIAKKDLVLSRYISTILMTLIISLLFSFFVIILGLSLKSGLELLMMLDIKNMVLAISIVMILASIIIPIYYSKFTRMRNLIFFLPITIMAISNISNTRERITLNNRQAIFNFLDKPLVVIIVLGISLIIYYLSYLISKKIYMKKEY